jgi:hypothetical protein
MKQSAVEFLVELLNNLNDNFNLAFKDEIEQAKEMEKQQQGYSEEDIKHAFFSGCYSERKIKPRIKCYEEFIEQFKNK